MKDTENSGKAITNALIMAEPEKQQRYMSHRSNMQITMESFCIARPERCAGLTARSRPAFPTDMESKTTKVNIKTCLQKATW